MNKIPISACACLGPQKGEEFCPCVMIARGLRTHEDYEPSDEEKAELTKALESFCQSNKSNPALPTVQSAESVLTKISTDRIIGEMARNASDIANDFLP